LAVLKKFGIYMYLEMFGFDEKPFHITPNPRFIFLSKIHKEAFAHLLYGIQQRVGFLSLSGEIGTGKTTVLRTLLGQLEEAEYRVALIFNPCLSALELLQTIHREFNIDFDTDSSNLVQLHDSLNQFLLQQREAGKTVVLVVDEAQNLDPKVLEQLRLLSNLETETEKLIQIVLVGQPELDELLQRKDLRQLRQRLAVSYHLQAMDAEDTQRYVLHRARIAGCQNRALFSSQALAQIYKYTQGTPRLINILCDRALLVAYGRDAQSVSKKDVQVAQAELKQQQKSSGGLLKPVLLAAFFLLIFVVLIKLFLTQNWNTPATRIAQQENTEIQANMPITIVRQPVVVEPAVSPERVTELTAAVAAISTADSGQQALAKISELWQRPALNQLEPISGRREMKQALLRAGLDLVDIQGSVEDLLIIDAPLVLEITLPNLVGKRFLALHQATDSRVMTSPSLTESGWLSTDELKQIWFGKAFLPYLNYRSIPLLDQPDRSGPHVSAVQQLLNALPEIDLAQTDRYDKQTIEAVTDFQRQLELAPDGRVGGHTLYWLYRKSGYQMPRLSLEEGS
jgi:general secretion pathway protein A